MISIDIIIDVVVLFLSLEVKFILIEFNQSIIFVDFYSISNDMFIMRIWKKAIVKKCV
jgi:hypothetical protein